MIFFTLYFAFGLIISILTLGIVWSDPEGFKRYVKNDKISNHILKNKLLYFILLILLSPLFTVLAMIKKILGGKSNK